MTRSKLFLAVLAAGFLAAVAQPALAEEGTTDAGAQVVIPDTNGESGASLTYNPSPGVAMGWQTTANAYAITSTNLSAGSDSRMEYGIASNMAGYYQVMEANPDAAGATSAEVGAADTPGTWDDTADPPELPSDTNFDGWSYMGGGAAAAAAEPAAQ